MMFPLCICVVSRARFDIINMIYLQGVCVGKWLVESWDHLD